VIDIAKSLFKLGKAFRVVPEMTGRFRWLGFLLGVISFFVYCVCRSDYAFPHDWTTVLTAVAGGYPFLPLQRPVWQSIVYLVSGLPGLMPVMALNYISAALSAFMVGLVFEVAYLWRRLPSIRYAFPREHIKIMEESRLWAGVLTGLAAMIAAPVFVAATTGHPNALDSALFAGVMWMSLKFRESESPGYARGAALLYGFGLVEQPLFLIMVPFLFFWWAVLLREAAPGRRIATGLNMFACLLPGLIFGAVFCVLYSKMSSANWLGMTEPIAVMWHFAGIYFRMFAQVITQTGWLLILMTTLLPAAYLQLAGFQLSESTEYATGQWLMLIVLAGLSFVLLFNLPGAPVSVASLLGLNIPYLIAAFWIGQLFAYLISLLGRTLRKHRQDAKRQGLFYAAYTAMILIFLLAGMITVFRFHPNQGRPLRDVARSMLEAMGDRHYLVSTGYLDDFLFWEARVREQPLSLIQLRYAQNPSYRKFLTDQLLGISIGFSEPPTMDRIFAERFGGDTNLHEQMALEINPGAWALSGFSWFPAAGVYLGMPREASLADRLNGPETALTRDLLQGQKEALQPRRLSHTSLEPSLRMLRHRLSVLANNLGFRHAEAGLSEEAGEYYEIALHYNLHNLSAMLNRIPMLARGGRKLEADILEEQARRHIARDAKLDPEALAGAFGYVFEDSSWINNAAWWPLKPTYPPPQEQVVTAGSGDHSSGRHVEDLQRISTALRDPAKKGFAAIELLALGEAMQHKDMMQTAITILTGMPDFPDGQRLLFNYSLRQGDIESARTFLQQVSKLAPGDREVFRALIHFEQRHGNREHLLAVAREAIALDANHAEANYLLAEDLAMDGRYEEAEAALLKIAPEQRSALVHTGLALHTWRQGRNDDALAWIDRAIAQAPGQSNPVGIRGIILADTGDWTNALPLLERAVQTIPPDQPALARLHLARVYVELEKPALARPLLDLFSEADLDESGRKLFNDMKKAMAGQVDQSNL
jgi:tetratricopeptide (TPR) repeat protein